MANTAVSVESTSTGGSSTIAATRKDFLTTGPTGPRLPNRTNA